MTLNTDNVFRYGKHCALYAKSALCPLCKKRIFVHYGEYCAFDDVMTIHFENFGKKIHFFGANAQDSPKGNSCQRDSMREDGCRMNLRQSP